MWFGSSTDASVHEEKNYDLTRQVDGKVLYVNGEVRRTRDHVLGQIHHTQSYVFLLNRTKHETFAQSAEEDTQNPTRPAPPVRTLYGYTWQDNGTYI